MRYFRNVILPPVRHAATPLSRRQETDPRGQQPAAGLQRLLAADRRPGAGGSHRPLHQQPGQQRCRQRTRARDLREEIRATLAKSDNENYLNVANEVRDLEDESFADLVVDVNLAEIDRDLTELRAVEAALRALREGRYGICEDCARPIDLERLQVAPQATRCINCQTTWERTHWQRIGHTL